MPAALLAACGGGGAEEDFPAGFLRASEAPLRRDILGVGAGRASALAASGANSANSANSANAAVPTPTQLFDWAEIHYPEFFPGQQADQYFAPYSYRLYLQTGNAVGVANGMVYILGPVAGNNDVPVAVGLLKEYTEPVFAGRFAYSDAQAARFLNQATLAATDADIAAVRSLGYEAWLQQQFNTPPSTSNWDWLLSRGYGENESSRVGSAGFDNQIWQRLLKAPDGLRQRVALALSEIFVVGLDGINGTYKPFRMAAYWDLLAEHAFGNFRTLLQAVTLSPAMGNYLNMAGNQKANPATGRVPDENYAREVMQLFTLGLTQLNPDGTTQLDAQGHALDSYTEADVKALAAVLTGWNFDRRASVSPVEQNRVPMLLNPSLHATTAATVLGTTIPANLDGNEALRRVLDALANHPNVGPFIGRQLIQRLVTSNPSSAYVARVAAAFANNGLGLRGDLAATLRAVLLDDEARAAEGLTAPAFGKLREPLQRLLQWARSFKAASLSGNWTLGNLSDAATRLGQSPQRSPSVFNFFRPGYVPPNTAVSKAGLVAPEMQLTTETSVAGYLNYMQTLSSAKHGDLRPDYSAELALAADPAALVARLNLLLCADQLGASTLLLITDAVGSVSGTGNSGPFNRVYTAVLLVLASPEFLHQR